MVTQKLEQVETTQSDTRLEQQALAGQFVLEALDVIAAERVKAFLPPMNHIEESNIVDEVLATLFGLGAVERLLADESIENINANGCDIVWVYHANGVKRQAKAIAKSDNELVALIRKAAARLGRNERRFDIANPFLDLKLPDGSRLNTVMSVSERPALSIRRHRHEQVTLHDLCKSGTFDKALQNFLWAVVQARMSIIICGGTNAGKTTLLRALLNACHPDERLITIEDRLELSLAADPNRHRDVIELETRTANIEGLGEITMQQLVRNALAMSPDRLIVGEVRGPEVVDMLAALSTGNDGSMCTIHANSSQAAFSKIATYALRSSERIPVEVTNRMIAESINFVVHLSKDSHGHRQVISVREVIGYSMGEVSSTEVFGPNSSDLNTLLQSSTRERLTSVGFESTVSEQDPKVLNY
ncbi:CpaF family protein [Candidatus Poriferisocius sp.]|uniref:CpaF family protein n=1 Tax=Candidatus Poriferisocius sp. TaxID=3101276 RepID=UPI003B023893